MHSAIRFVLLTVVVLSCRPANGMNISFIMNYSSCGNPVGWIRAVGQGGTPPYSYAWNTGATTDSIGGLVGTGQWFVVTVTDALLQVQVDSAQLFNDANLSVAATSYVANDYGLSAPIPMHPCPFNCNGGLVMHQEYINGAPPYNVTCDMGVGVTMFDDIGNPIFGGFCKDDWVTFTVVDNYGCTGQYSETITGASGNYISILQVDGACAGAPNGNVWITADLNELPWIYQVEVLDDQLNQITWLADIDLYDTATVSGLAAGDYTARVHWRITNPLCWEDHLFTVPDLGIACGNVSGTVYFDHDQDCTQDINDPGIPYRLLTIGGGGGFAITDANGHYARNLPNGSYDIGVNGADLVPICPAASPVPFTISNGTSIAQDFADSSAVDMDLDAWMHNTPARPGFMSTCYGAVHNLGGQLTGAVTIAVTFDPLFTYVGSSPAGGNLVGNVVTWTVAELNSFGMQNVSVTLSLPPDPLLIGVPFLQSITCSATFSESSLANNADNYSAVITGSFDPNEKLVSTSTGLDDTIYFIDLDSAITYTIGFQNTGTDTAFTVVIMDTLSGFLDLSTLEIIGGSHAFVPDFTDQRVLRFTFNNILLPDSNTNEPASHGYVSFRVRPDEDNVDLFGSVIANAADIYFDFNPPVRTNNADLLAEFSVVVQEQEQARLRAWPNPADNVLMVLRGTDLAGWLELRAVDGRVVDRVLAIGTGVQLDLSGLAPGLYSLSDAADAHRAVRFVRR